MKTVPAVVALTLLSSTMAHAQLPKIQRGTADPDASFVVDIKGTGSFSGTCLVTDRGRAVSVDASGRLQRTLIVEGTMISCVVQKQEEGGVLIMAISRGDGAFVGRSTTQQAFGLVTVAGR